MPSQRAYTLAPPRAAHPSHPGVAASGASTCIPGSHCPPKATDVTVPFGARQAPAAAYACRGVRQRRAGTALLRRQVARRKSRRGEQQAQLRNRMVERAEGARDVVAMAGRRTIFWVS